MKNMEKENKTLNLCKKLAECPEGTKLWSPLFGECEFVRISRKYDRIVVDSPVLTGVSLFDEHGHYFDTSEECMLFPSRENRDWDSWECPKPKEERFDPKTLQPFDKVLVRDETGNNNWNASLFIRIEPGWDYTVLTISSAWKWCVPYNEDTKHLLGTSKEAPEFYRWWEDK